MGAITSIGFSMSEISFRFNLQTVTSDHDTFAPIGQIRSECIGYGYGYSCRFSFRAGLKVWQRGVRT